MRIFVLLLGLLLIALPASALPVIGVELYRSDDTFVSSMCGEMVQAAEGRAELDVTDGKNDQAIQNDLISRHVARRVDALAINPVDPTASSILLEKAQTAGIPVVFFNCEPDAADMPESGWYYVGARAEQSGTMQGELMAAYFISNPGADLDGDGVIRCVMLTGEAFHLDAPLRTEYSLKAFKAAGFKVSLVASESANWQRGEARDIMTGWLASYDGIEAVFANNDDMALGAIDALKAAGYFSGGRTMPVVGVDATEPALEALREGSLLGTVLNDAANQGKAVVNLSLALARGETPNQENVGYPVSSGRYVWIPYRKVTPESLRVPGPKLP